MPCNRRRRRQLLRSLLPWVVVITNAITCFLSMHVFWPGRRRRFKQVLLQNTGMWMGNNRDKALFLAKFAILCYFSTYTTQLVALVHSKNDIERFFECFSVISFCGMGIMKLFSVYKKREHWLVILHRLSNLEMEYLASNMELSLAEYESEDEDICDVTGTVRLYTDNFRRTSKILFKIYCFTGAIFIFSPFIEYAFRIARGQELDYPHILPSWNPLDSVHFLLYIVTIVFEAVAASYCVCIHIAFDTIVIGVIISICGQFSALIYQCKRIGGRGKQFGLSKRRDLRAHARIIKCHRVHVLLISSINELDRLLKNILGVYFFLATLTLCSVAIRLKSNRLSIMQLASLLQYMCATLTQLYLYCRFGDAVYNGSAIGAGEGPYAAVLWCLSSQIKREVAILGFGMMKPRKLHAGPFHSVDLKSFIQIVRAAYSYYAVLGNSKTE